MTSRYMAIACAIFLMAFQPQAQAAQVKSAADEALEQRVRQFQFSNFEKTKQEPKSQTDWKISAQALAKLPKTVKPGFALETCLETKTIEFGDRYALTFDTVAQRPCKIYDLSFPTLATATGIHPVSQLPVQSFTSEDYLNWIDGKYDQVYQGIKTFKKTYSGSTPSQEKAASWVAGVKFKSDRIGSVKFMNGAGANGLPAAFRASDLELGGKFAFSDYERQLLKRVLAQNRGSIPAFFNSSGNSSSASTWSNVVDNPGGLLEKIKFIWNDAEKVYDVALEGEFFPIAGPMALVDFTTPYKASMEKMIRGIVESAVLRLVDSVVVEPISHRIVTVALNDTFEFIEDMYVHQMNQMEPALRLGAQGHFGNEIDAKTYNRGLDLLFSTRSGFFNDYVMGLALGEQYDWTRIEKVGRDARYQAEKTRDISMNNRHSELVLKSGCETRIVHDYFAVCMKDGQNQGVYSLLSEYSVLFWGFGAPLVHRPSFKSEVVLKRVTARLLASGLRMGRLPIIGYVTDTLADQLKIYAMTGMDDEAFLRASLLSEKRGKGALDSDSAEMLKWLYIQNINPFLPKTESGDGDVINANKAQLTLVNPSHR